MDALLQLLLTKEGVTSHNNKQNIFIIFCRFCCLHSVHDFFVWQEMKSIMLKGKILTLTVMGSHMYQFNGQCRLQLNSGAIGLELTGELADLLMSTCSL